MNRVQNYCDSLVIELSGWKAKIYDVVRKMDKLSSGDKEKVNSQVNDLHILIEELEDRIDRLEPNALQIGNRTKLRSSQK